MKPSGFAMAVFKKRLKGGGEDDPMEPGGDEEESEEGEEDPGCEAAVRKFFEAGNSGDYSKAARFLKAAINLA